MSETHLEKLITTMCDTTDYTDAEIREELAEAGIDLDAEKAKFLPKLDAMMAARAGRRAIEALKIWPTPAQGVLLPWAASESPDFPEAADLVTANGGLVATLLWPVNAAHIAAAVNAAPYLLAENARLAGQLLLREAGERTGAAMFASWVSMECKKVGVENELGSVPVLIEKCGAMKRELDFLEREREGFGSARAEDYTIKNNLLARVAELEAEKETLQARFDDLLSAAQEVAEVARLRGEGHLNPEDDPVLWTSRWNEALANIAEEVEK